MPYYLSRNNVTTALGNLITLLGNKIADVGRMSFSTVPKHVSHQRWWMPLTNIGCCLSPMLVAASHQYW
jgi:hypothetical protein